MVRRRYSESALNRRAALFESRPRRRFREEDEIEDEDMEFEGDEDMEDEGTDEGGTDTVNIEMTEDEYKALVKFAKKAEKAGFSEADIDLEEARRRFERKKNARAVLEAVRRARRYREDRELSMDARRRRAMLERRLAARKRIAEARMRRIGRR